MKPNSGKQQHSQPAQQKPAPGARKTESAQNPPSPASDGVEGEGSYTATRRYNAGVQEHLQTHDVEAEAEEAREALEGEEGPELEAAEQRGKRGPARGTQSPQQQRPQPSNGKH